MPTKPQDEDQHTEAEAQNISPSTVYSQPGWHSVGNGVVSSFCETNGVMKVGAQLQTNGDSVAKDTDSSTAPQSGLNGDDNQERQEVKHVETNAPMELVGHSIVLTSYPYQDPHYAGMMTYGAQTYPHLLGTHQNRMLLPLQMEEEPVYVNAKQYHGILRRRQSRAKAELERKEIKSRKPYLHESRHQHAMKRARGCGGRFLNTKKLNPNATTNSSPHKDPKSGSTKSFNSSGSDHLSTDYEGNSSMYNFHEEVRYINCEKGNMVNQVRKGDPYYK